MLIVQYDKSLSIHTNSIHTKGSNRLFPTDRGTRFYGDAHVHLRMNS